MQDVMVRYHLDDEDEPREERASVALQGFWDDLEEFRDCLECNEQPCTRLALSMARRAAALRENGILLVGYTVPETLEIKGGKATPVGVIGGPLGSGGGPVN